MISWVLALLASSQVPYELLALVLFLSRDNHPQIGSSHVEGGYLNENGKDLVFTSSIIRDCAMAKCRSLPFYTTILQCGPNCAKILLKNYIKSNLNQRNQKQH